MPVIPTFSAFPKGPDLVGVKRGVVADQQRAIEAAMDWQIKGRQLRQQADQLAQQWQLANMKLALDREQSQRDAELKQATLDYSKAYHDQMASLEAQKLADAWTINNQELQLKSRALEVTEGEAFDKAQAEDTYRSAVAAGIPTGEAIEMAGPSLGAAFTSRAHIPQRYAKPIETYGESGTLYQASSDVDQWQPVIDPAASIRKNELVNLMEAQERDTPGKLAYQMILDPKTNTIDPKKFDKLSDTRKAMLKTYMDRMSRIKTLEQGFRIPALRITPPSGTSTNPSGVIVRRKK